VTSWLLTMARSRKLITDSIADAAS
jgi:hypothetical protein